MYLGVSSEPFSSTQTFHHCILSLQQGQDSISHDDNKTVHYVVRYGDLGSHNFQW